eukprot:4453744-Prymnesium_polylepis.1
MPYCDRPAWPSDVFSERVMKLSSLNMPCSLQLQQPPPRPRTARCSVEPARKPRHSSDGPTSSPVSYTHLTLPTICSV